VCCSVLQCVVACYSVLQCIASGPTFVRPAAPSKLADPGVLQCKLQCVLQCVAVCCSMLQYVAVCCNVV